MAFAEGTVVPVAKTRGEVEALVQKYGATRFASGWVDDTKAAISFVASGRLVRFVLALPTDDDAKKKTPRRRGWRSPTEAQWRKWKDAETRRRWRCLLLAIKAKLEVVESGIHSFEQEFLAHIVTSDNITVYEAIRLQSSGVKLLGPAEEPGR